MELEIGDGSEWSFVTEELHNSGSEPKWKDLKFAGRISETEAVGDSMKIRVKDSNNETDNNIIGKGILSLTDIVSQSNSWMDLIGELMDKEGNTGCGNFSIKARFRTADNEDIADDAMSVVSKSTRPPPTPSKDDLARASEKGSPRYGEWAEIEDADGNKYYYNASTGETSWEMPDENGQLPHQDVDVVRHGDWIQTQDENGNFYWYNEVSGESAWELPSDEPEEYQMHDIPSSSGQGSFHSKEQKPYASASAGGYTIEL